MKKPTLHLICNAHLDPVWQWQWEEGCAETLATFRNAVEILNEYPDLIFNHNEAILYMWVRKYDPPLFKEIQRLVKKKRWFISGGWYLQPDVNLPGTESLIRHILEGRRFFKEFFNADPRVAYNFDSFGHSGGLPQILQLAGYRMYIHMRPQTHDLELPSDLYRWRGVDGSEVVGLRIEIGLYHTERDNIQQRLQEGTDMALQINRDVPVFWGLGNHGGGATRADLQKIEEFRQRESRVNIIHSTTDQLYEALKEEAEKAPVVFGDLQRVFTGCYTSLSRIKRRAQQSLAGLLQAEALSAAAWWQYGAKYPAISLKKTWLKHLFNDFHDILPGSCTEPAEQDALNLYGSVSEAVKSLRLKAAVNFNRHFGIKTDLPVTVLNTNPSHTRVPVEVECMIDYRPKWSGLWYLQLFNQRGEEIPCQEEQPEALLPFNGWRRKVCFMADLPGLGAAAYRLQLVEGEKQRPDSPPAISHQIDEKSGLIHYLDCGGSGKNCLKSGLFQPLVMEDDGDSWGTDRWSYREIAGVFKPQRPAAVIQKGPVRTITETQLQYQSSRIILHTIAYSQWPVLEFRFRIHWNEERKRLKLAIPTIFNAEHILCEVPGGIIARPADGQEHVHGRWFVIQNEAPGQKNGLAIINSGQHGLDFIDGEIRLSVLRSAAYCHEQGFKISEFPARKYMDQGVHEVRILLTVGNQDVLLKQATALADWLSAPPVAYAHLPALQTKAPKAPLSREVLSLQPENIRLLAFKQAANGKSLIIRLQETAGIKTAASMELKYPGVAASLHFSPFEIKTIRFEKNGKWREVNMIREV